MADNYLEKKQAEYEVKKIAWQKEKRLREIRKMQERRIGVRKGEE